MCDLTFSLLITCNYRKEEGVITYLILDQNGLYGFMDSSILQFPTVVDLVDFCCHYSTLGPLKEGVAKDKVTFSI